MKIKALFLLLTLAIQGLAFGAGKQNRYRTNYIYPQSGYWYNATDSVVEVRIYDYTKEAHGISESTLIKPYELIKMTPFTGNELVRFNGKVTFSFRYNKKGAWLEKHYGASSLSGNSLANLGGEYVIVFKDEPSSDVGLKFEVAPYKEFREKYAKELAACPVPAGVQRMIAGYVLPETEKPQAKE